MNMLLLLLPGTPHTFQGEEIGMKNIQLTYEQTTDPWGRNAGPVRQTWFHFKDLFTPRRQRQRRVNAAMTLNDTGPVESKGVPPELVATHSGVTICFHYFHW